jgi:muramidase (phage lysozyme)
LGLISVFSQPRRSRFALLASSLVVLCAGFSAPAKANTSAEMLMAARPAAALELGRPRSQLAMLNVSDGPSALERFFRYALTPERRALLNTIRYAEGTWARGEDVGYRIMFGGGLMPGLDRHPDRVISTGRYASAAAGAYQFMPFTWAMASRSLSLQGFGPEVQDQAALFLIQRRGALHLADRGEFTPHLAAKLAPEWASFPTMAGHSYYGQPVKRYVALKAFYEANLAELRTLAGSATPIAVEPVCEPVDSLRCRLEKLDRIGPRSVAQGR